MTLSKYEHLKHQEKQQATWLLLIGIILISANLRGPLTSVGSLITFIRDDLSISNTLIGSLTTLPLLAFAFLSPLVPKIYERLGMELTIFIALIVLTIGVIFRSLFDVTTLFIGTALIGLGIAVGNVLLPAFVKMKFPLKVGMVTGIYVVSMNLFGALGSGVSVPLSSFRDIGWKGSLGVWAFLAFIALIVWLPQLKTRANKEAMSEVAATGANTNGNVWRSPLAWCITIFMGLQSLIFYTTITWLPDLLQTYGYSSSAGGWLLFLLQFTVIPFNFIIPIIAEKMRNQILLSVITASLLILGSIGLLINHPFFIPAAVISIGIGCGSAFSLSMMFFSLRTNNSHEAANISGMAQSFGYLLAAFGPVVFGALHDLTNGWVLPLSMLIAISVIILIAGIEAGKDKSISNAPKDKTVSNV